MGVVVATRAAVSRVLHLAWETWSGTSGAAWPAQWTTIIGTLTLNGSNQGLATPPATGTYGTARGYLTTPTAKANFDIYVSVQGTFSSVEQYAVINIDDDGNINSGGAGGWAGNNGYGFVLYYNATPASSTINFQTYTSSSATAGASPVTITLNGTTKYRCRVTRVGTSIQGKLWDASTAEPGSYQVSYTVASSSTPTGKVGLAGVNGSNATSRPFIFTDLTVD